MYHVLFFSDDYVGSFANWFDDGMIKIVRVAMAGW